jgi:hypothetical protein
MRNVRSREFVEEADFAAAERQVNHEPAAWIVHRVAQYSFPWDIFDDWRIRHGGA